MVEKMKFKSLFMFVMAVLMSVTAVSCLGDDEEEIVWVEEVASETGLCNATWVLTSIIGEEVETDVPYKSYTFNLSGTGYLQYTDEATGEIKTDNFTWKSYKYGTSHKLSLIVEGYENQGAAETLYAIQNMVTLRLQVQAENGYIAVEEYTAE